MRHIKFKLNPTEYRAFRAFSNDTGILDLNELAKKCLIYAVNDSARRSREMMERAQREVQAEQQGEAASGTGNNTESGDAGRDTEASFTSETAPSNPLAEA